MQLLQELEDPSFRTVVHLDENSSPDYKAVVSSIVKPFARTSLATSPVPCSWGGVWCLQPAFAHLAPVWAQALAGDGVAT